MEGWKQSYSQSFQQLAGNLNMAFVEAKTSAKRYPFANPGLLLMLPATGFLLIVFVVPFLYVVYLSFGDQSFSLDQYKRIFTGSLYLRVGLNTLVTSLTVTLACLALGYPVAYVMATRRGALPALLFGLVTLSFWTGFLVRTYAWLVILGNRGPIVGSLRWLGIDPPQLLYTSFSSTLAMTHLLLPYMIMILFGVMRKIDPNYPRAAESLGARPFAVFWEIFLPLSFPGVVNGCMLVFTICLGFYVTPVLLGGVKDMMISQLINQQITELLNWSFASALSVFLLTCTMIIYAAYNRFFGLNRLWG
jgi:putative spermidine/putrescine transport system permease protein